MKCPLRLIKVGIDRKKFKWLFSPKQLPLFFKNLCFRQPHSSKKSSHNFHSNCHNTFWIPRKFSLRLIILDIARKIVQLIFFTETIALFFKNLCFQHFLRCDRNNLITSTISVRKPFGSLQIVP